jgi:hypothetical protein
MISLVNKTFGRIFGFHENVVGMWTDDLRFKNSSLIPAYKGKYPEIVLEREPKNLYDSNAIKVFLIEVSDEHTQNKIHIGYIRRGTAAWLSPLMKEGYRVDVKTHLVHSTGISLRLRVIR